MSSQVTTPTDKCNTFADLEQRLAAWHKRNFPGGVPSQRSYVKAMEEMGELAAELLIIWQKGRQERAITEAADVAIVLAHLVRGLGGNLFDAMERKLSECERKEAR